MVKNIPPSLAGPKNPADARTEQQTRTEISLREDVAHAAPSTRTIINPYSKKQPDYQENKVVRVRPAANAPATGQIINPYAKRPAPRQLDATKMLMDSKYREFHRRPVPNSEPPIPFPGSKTAKAPDPGEQYRNSGSLDTKLTMRKYLKDAYFKVDNYNYVTTDKHQELLRTKNSKIRPPENIIAHNQVLLSDPTKTMLVSPQKLATLDENFASKKFKEQNIDQESDILKQTRKIRHEILILSPKSDHVFALTNQTGNRKFKPHQIFVAVGDEQERHYADLRALIAEKKIPPLSKDAQNQLRKITELETRAQLSGLMTSQPETSATVKRSSTVLDTGRQNDDSPATSSPAKKIRSELNDRSRDKAADRSL